MRVCVCVCEANRPAGEAKNREGTRADLSRRYVISALPITMVCVFVNRDPHSLFGRRFFSSYPLCCRIRSGEMGRGGVSQQGAFSYLNCIFLLFVPKERSCRARAEINSPFLFAGGAFDSFKRRPRVDSGNARVRLSAIKKERPSSSSLSLSLSLPSSR